jgi:hypothetical protein
MPARAKAPYATTDTAACNSNHGFTGRTFFTAEGIGNASAIPWSKNTKGEVNTPKSESL